MESKKAKSRAIGAYLITNILGMIAVVTAISHSRWATYGFAIASGVFGLIFIALMIRSDLHIYRENKRLAA
jgi:hypothetical protein